MQKREFHPLELVLPGLFLFVVYCSLFSKFNPFAKNTSARARYERAQLLMKRGKYPQALTYVKKLTRDFPSNHVFWTLQGDIQRRIGNFRAEANALEKVMVYSSVPDEVCPRIGQAYEAAGKKQLMLDAYKRCFQLAPNSSDSHLFLALGYEKTGNPALALTEYQSCLERSPTYLDCGAGLARIHLLQGEPEVALQVLESDFLKGKVDADADALLARAIAQRQLGRAPAAKKDLKKAIELAPNYASVKEELNSLEATTQ